MLQLKGIYKTFNAGTVNEKRAIDNLNLTAISLPSSAATAPASPPR